MIPKDLHVRPAFLRVPSASPPPQREGIQTFRGPDTATNRPADGLPGIVRWDPVDIEEELADLRLQFIEIARPEPGTRTLGSNAAAAQYPSTPAAVEGDETRDVARGIDVALADEDGEFNVMRLEVDAAFARVVSENPSEALIRSYLWHLCADRFDQEAEDPAAFYHPSEAYYIGRDLKVEELDVDAATQVCRERFIGKREEWIDAAADETTEKVRNLVTARPEDLEEALQQLKTDIGVFYFDEARVLMRNYLAED